MQNMNMWKRLPSFDISMHFPYDIEMQRLTHLQFRMFIHRSIYACKFKIV
jgi:hypothetical protein